MDKILFNGMQFYAYHGVFEEENKLGQIFKIDLELMLDLQRAGQSDALEDTINYAEVYQVIQNVIETEQFNLIEKLAEEVVLKIMELYASIKEMMVRVIKPNPPIPGYYDSVAVEIRRRR